MPASTTCQCRRRVSVDDVPASMSPALRAAFLHTRAQRDPRSPGGERTQPKQAVGRLFSRSGFGRILWNLEHNPPNLKRPPVDARNPCTESVSTKTCVDIADACRCDPGRLGAWRGVLVRQLCAQCKTERERLQARDTHTTARETEQKTVLDGRGRLTSHDLQLHTSQPEPVAACVCITAHTALTHNSNGH